MDLSAVVGRTDLIGGADTRPDREVGRNGGDVLEHDGPCEGLARPRRAGVGGQCRVNAVARAGGASHFAMTSVPERVTVGRCGAIGFSVVVFNLARYRPSTAI